MPAKAPAAHFSQVISDYLSSAIAVSYGAPATTAVQRRHLTTTVAVTNPNLLITADVDPQSSSELLMLNVSLVLTVQLGVETGQTTEAQAQTWMQSFRALLSSDPEAYDAWDQWVGTLTTEQKAGWYLQSFWPQALERSLDAESNVLTLTAPYQMVSFWND